MSLADIGWCPPYLLLDPVKSGDPLQQIRGQRGWLAHVVLEYLAPEMRPAGDFADTASGIELLISGIAIGLEQASELLEIGLRMNAAAVRREAVPDQRRSARARCAVVDNVGPEPRLRGLAFTRNQHWHGRIVGMELAGLEALLANAANDGIE